MAELSERREYQTMNRKQGAAALTTRVLVGFPRMVLAGLLALLIIFLVMSVISRYFMQLGTPWSDEFARILFAWIVMVGFAVAGQQRANVAVDILVEQAGPRMKRALYILQDALILVFSVVFTYAAYQTVQFASIQTLPGLGITIGWLYSSCVAAGVLMVVYATLMLIQTLRGQRQPPHYEAGGDL
ncbi:TRAP transporter small permease [Bordetella bronchiseptica]|uniref:TRAP transporter small permease n=1 Tax=Bordetella bronchiseptica TaxID=518 RepID=UPI000444AAEF|nr:TRAP transporter small permease [Bordetella bronchiseptica]BAO68263.1 hypothetical protein BBS798_1537 [Bordetella bronchiseptica]